MQLQWTLIVVNKWFPSEEKRVEGGRFLVLRRAHRWPQHGSGPSLVPAEQRSQRRAPALWPI